METFRPILCIFPEMQLTYDPAPRDPRIRVTNIASSRGFNAKMTGSSFVQLASGEIIGELLGIVDFPAAKRVLGSH